MKKSLIIGALALTAVVQAQPSQAYFRGNYCAKIDIGGGVVQERCDFPSVAACMAYTGTMPKAFCVQNQWSARNWGAGDRSSEDAFNWRYR
jgi:hypothetical protein